MQVFVALLILAFIAGGTSSGARVRRHPILLVGLTLLVATSLYSLRVVL